MSIETFIQHYGIAAIFLGAAFEGETAVVAGGLLAHAGFVSLPGAMAAASAGSCVADQLFFFIGRYFREGRVVRWARAKPAFARALGWIEWWPTGFIFAFRFIYGLRTVSPFAIGATKVETRLFVIVNVVAAIVWGCVFTALGYAFGHQVEAWLARIQPSGRTLLIVGGVVAVVAVLSLAARWWWRRRKVMA